MACGARSGLKPSCWAGNRVLSSAAKWPVKPTQGENDIIYSPRVIVEVPSPSTEAIDRGKKFRYYQSCPSIQEYVLISAKEQAVDVYRRASDNLWTLHPFAPGNEVELKSINVSIPLEAFYENVTVPKESA